MDFHHTTALLCATALVVFGVHGDSESKGFFWSEQSLPVLMEVNTSPSDPPSFSNQRPDEARAFCGIECQSNLLPLDQPEQERLLGYETMHEDSTCTHTDVSLRGFNQSMVAENTRKKRHVYGEDGRFVISDSYFVTHYPFATAVRLSTGCSGVLVSPKHVLTAAHCVHNGRDYLEEAKQLKVGVLQLKTKRERRGRKRRRQVRIGRSVASNGPPVFRWTLVKETRLPQGWILKLNNNSLSSDYNYALLELKRPVKQKPMDLGVAPVKTSMGRIHFSSFDADKSHLDGRGKERVVYRFCSVAKESDDLIYQHCDAQTGAIGAGVYVRRREGTRGKWQRRVIGVYTGPQWVEARDGEQREYNVAVRITPAKYAQICHWIHGDPKLCKKI